MQAVHDANETQKEARFVSKQTSDSYPKDLELSIQIVKQAFVLGQH